MGKSVRVSGLAKKRIARIDRDKRMENRYRESKCISCTILLSILIMIVDNLQTGTMSLNKLEV